MYMGVLPTWISMCAVPDKALDPLELKLQIAVSHHVEAGN